MNPDVNSNEPILSRFLRQLYESQARQAENNRHRGDHKKRNSAAKRQHNRRIAANSRKRNRS